MRTWTSWMVFAIGLAMASVGLAQGVVINEVAWMGTSTSSSDEWIELHNAAGAAVDLTGWTLEAVDGTPSIALTGSIPAHGYFLLERTDDTTIPSWPADLIYTGAMENGGEDLVLRDHSGNVVDQVSTWHAGDNTTKAAMSRISSLAASSDPANWQNPTLSYAVGFGTPGSSNADLVISEVAWMGTTASSNDEWIELHNPTGNVVDLAGWTLAAADGTPSISLSGVVPSLGYFLLERTDDSSVPEVGAGLIYTGALENGGEILELRDGGGSLIDWVDLWHAGNNGNKATMERAVVTAPGNDPAAWANGAAAYSGGLGSPAHGGASGPGGGVGTSSDWFSVYFSNHQGTVFPGAVGPSPAGQALIDAIDAATTSVDFALYGVGGSQGVIDALAAAQARGVSVRGVMDTYASGWFPYRDSDTLIAALTPGSVVLDNDDRIMHNKFLVFDDRWVWTGSGNLSDTGIYADYNSNWSILMDHPEVALAYKIEFEEMFSGLFHDAKSDNTPHLFAPLADGTTVESYFAPTDDAKANAIIPAINSAANTLDIRIFFFTDWDTRDAVIAAHQRGVAVRVIIDASSSESQYSVHGDLRAAGIPVKVENWAGKEHMKALAVDGQAVILGSQNWTGSGNTASDENTLYIENAPLAAAFEADFEIAWASIPAQWQTGTPGAESVDSPGSTSDFIDNDHDGLTDEGAPQSLGGVESGNGAINVYFNKSAFPGIAQERLANYNVNLEERLIARLNAAVNTIDLATYEINLPGLIDTLLARAAAGLDVRIVADAKDYLEGESSNYDRYVLSMERLLRGQDGTLGTADDIAILADSPVFAVLDNSLRTAHGLPAQPTDLPNQTLSVGNNSRTGYIVALGELKNATDYYSAGPQMHNKFVVFDETWVWTGSWNFTINGLYGSEANMAAGLLGGNTNHGVEIHSSALAGIYTDEFEEMWGSATTVPDPTQAKFHGRKVDNTAHVVTVGSRTVEVYFSPGDQALANVTQFVANEADYSASFCVFAWSDQGLLDELKLKYEGSKSDLVGSPTGFEVQGVYDSVFWNQWWSASVDMTGRIASDSSPGNPNTRWANAAPVYKDGEDAILHHKYMVIDGHTASNPAVITGSTNWSANGDTLNDENLLIIHDSGIADQFLQEFHARYYQAGGDLP